MKVVREALVPIALAAAVTTTACGGSEDEAATMPSSVTTTTGDNRIELARSCVHEERGVRVEVRYPQGWHVNNDDVQPCSAFDPEPFHLRPGTEFPRDLAVVLYVEPLAFDQLTSHTGVQVQAERPMTIDGRRAVRQVVTAGGALPSPHRTSTRYVVDAGTERSIVATTFHVEGNDYERSVETLDAIVGTFEIEPLNP